MSLQIVYNVYTEYSYTIHSIYLRTNSIVSVDNIILPNSLQHITYFYILLFIHRTIVSITKI